MSNSRSAIFLCIQGVLVLLFCMGCGGTLFKNYGGITPNADASKTFEAYRISPNYNYYTSGPYTYPNAIMGLDKTYTLDSDLWKKIEPTPQEFQELVTNMQKKALSFRQHQHGFIIHDDKGRQIGVLYSILSVKTTVLMKEDRKVLIFTPDLDTFGEHAD